MSVRANKKALVVPLDEARLRLRQVNPPPARPRRTRPRWVVIVAASLAVVLLLGLAARLALIDAGSSGYSIALGIVAAIVPLGLLWLANRARRDLRQRVAPPAPLRRNTPARHRPPSRPSRFRRS
jgi:hypothetical protein